MTFENYICVVLDDIVLCLLFISAFREMEQLTQGTCYYSKVFRVKSGVGFIDCLPNHAFQHQHGNNFAKY